MDCEWCGDGDGEEGWVWTGVVMGRVGVDCEWCGDGEEGWVWTVGGVVMGGGEVGLKGVINVSPLTPFISTQRVFVLPWK